MVASSLYYTEISNIFFASGRCDTIARRSRLRCTAVIAAMRKVDSLSSSPLVIKKTARFVLYDKTRAHRPYTARKATA